MHAGCRAPSEIQPDRMAALEYGVAGMHQSRHDTRAPDTALDDSMADTAHPPPPHAHEPHAMHAPSHSTNWKLTVDVQNVYKMVSPGLHASLRA